MATWTEEETVQLIDLWGEESVQEHLERCSNNRNVYEKIATEMRAAGYERTAVQCRDKIKKLRAEYKRAKDRNGLTGRGTKSGDTMTSWTQYWAIGLPPGHQLFWTLVMKPE